MNINLKYESEALLVSNFFSTFPMYKEWRKFNAYSDFAFNFCYYHSCISDIICNKPNASLNRYIFWNTIKYVANRKRQQTVEDLQYALIDWANINLPFFMGKNIFPITDWFAVFDLPLRETVPFRTYVDSYKNYSTIPPESLFWVAHKLLSTRYRVINLHNFYEAYANKYNRYLDNMYARHLEISLDTYITWCGWCAGETAKHLLSIAKKHGHKD